MKNSTIQVLLKLDLSDIAEIQIAGEVFDKKSEIASIVEGLHMSKRYSFKNEGCITPYQMQIVLSSNQKSSYAIAENRAHTTILIEPIEGGLPTYIIGTIVSSEKLLQSLKEINANMQFPQN